MKAIRAILTLSLLLAGSMAAAQTSNAPPRLYFWLWWANLEGQWKEMIDFTAAQKMDGVVIWGLGGFRGQAERCREIVAYAHAKNVKVIYGFGLNGYDSGNAIVSQHPELAATMPENLANTAKGRESRANIFCPSKPESLALLKQYLLAAADTGVDGFNFETADVDYITCHCPECEKRFQSAGETVISNKPLDWALEHLQIAADTLLSKHPDLWLSCEFRMIAFNKPPYAECDRILELTRKIDQRMTVVWADSSSSPTAAMASRLLAERQNLGFYIRSGAMLGWKAKQLLPPEEFQSIARSLLPLKPACVFYRAYRPCDRFAVNMGVAAQLLHNPHMPATELKGVVGDLEEMIKPGARYFGSPKDPVAD